MLAISGDIISEVAAAADPIRAAAARRRLEALSNDSVGHFASLVEPSQRPLSKPLAAQAPAAVTPPPRSVSPRRQGIAAPVASAYQALGGVLLQKTFEAMMPKLAGLSGANSSASSIWSSMLAQQLAESVSASVFHLSRGPAIAAPSQAVAIGGARRADFDGDLTMRDPYLALDNEAPEAPLDGLLRAVRRTCATINEETVALESGAAADYGEFRHRKDLCLLELSRRAPALVNPPRDPELNAALHDLKDAIIRNQKTLRCHVNAARQVSAIIMKSMAEEDSDHTYSTRAAGKRPPA